MANILVVGSVALDTVSSPYGKQKEILGGSATYFSISASFFHPVNLVAVVGRDFPYEYLKLLKERPIDLEGLVVKEGKTFRWKGEYNYNPNRVKTIATLLHVFKDFRPRIPLAYRKSDFVFLANIDPRIQEDVLRQVERPKLVALDTMSHWIKEKKDLLRSFLKKVDIFFLNDNEAYEFSGEHNLLKAARSICRYGVRWVIIKRGEHGAVLFSKDVFFILPAFLLERVVDPTGAGDSFAGGFLGYLAKKSTVKAEVLREAMLYGTVMASFAVEDFSLNRLISLTHREIQQRLNLFKKIVSL